MKKIYTLSFLITLAAVLLFATCEEDVEVLEMIEQQDSIVTVATIPPPTLSAIESTVSTIVKFEVRVAASQVQDTVHYLVLEADIDNPTHDTLLDHKSKTELPMAGNYSRTMFQSNLKEETQYMVYAVIKKGQQISEITSVAVATGTTE